MTKPQKPETRPYIFRLGDRTIFARPGHVLACSMVEAVVTVQAVSLQDAVEQVNALTEQTFVIHPRKGETHVVTFQLRPQCATGRHLVKSLDVPGE